MIEFRGGPLDGERYQDVVRGAIADGDAPPEFTAARFDQASGRTVEARYVLEGGAYRHRETREAAEG